LESKGDLNKYNNFIYEIEIGDWGLGIGPNPQSPIPNPQFMVEIFFILLSIIIYLRFTFKNHLQNYFF
jgi:hypothetical protein